MWFRNEGDPNVRYGDSFQWNSHRMGKANGPHPASFHLGEAWQRELLYHRFWGGFHVAKVVWNDDQRTISMWVVPYLSLVCPLMLLSAWLLISKPAKQKSNSVSPAPLPCDGLHRD